MPPDNLKTDFDEMFKASVVPFFKEFGFKRKTLHFARRTNDITQCFNVQKSQWNSYNNSLSFTFNLGFYNEDIRTLAWGRAMPTDFPKTTDCFIQDRLGSHSHKRDHWYELNKIVDRTEIANQVICDLNTYLRPLFENNISLNSLQGFLDSNPGFRFSPYSQIIFLMMTSQHQKAVVLLKEQYKNALTPQTRTQIFVYPDGRQDIKTSKPYINQDYVASIERLARHYAVEL